MVKEHSDLCKHHIDVEFLKRISELWEFRWANYLSIDEYPEEILLIFPYKYKRKHFSCKS